MFYFSHYIYMYVCIEMGATPLLSTTDYADWTDECPAAWLGARHKPNKPLGEDGGRCPCCYASALVL